jgi:hypothetical protein
MAKLPRTPLTSGYRASSTELRNTGLRGYLICVTQMRIARMRTTGIQEPVAAIATLQFAPVTLHYKVNIYSVNGISPLYGMP